MKKITFIALIFLCLFVALAYAGTSIKAEVTKPKLSADEAFIYRLTIATTEKKLPLPELPSFENFNLLSQAQSSTMSYAKNEIITTLIYEFYLAPTAAGQFIIKPSSIKINDSKVFTATFEIEVTPGSNQLPVSSGQKSTSPVKEVSESAGPRINL